MPELGHRHMATGVLVAIVNVLIFRHYVPSHADVRTATPFNTDVEASERMALTVGTVFTIATAMFARSVEVFAIGGIVLVALDFSMKHANAVNPDTGKMADSVSTSLSDSYPMPDYASTEG